MSSMEFVSNNVKLLAVDTYRKPGASKIDRENIAKLAADGKTVDEISLATNVQIAIVLRFMPAATKAFMGKPLPTYEEDPFAETAAPPAPSLGGKIKDMVKGKKHGTKYK